VKTYPSGFRAGLFVAVVGAAVAFGVMFQDKLGSRALEASITGLGEWAAFAFVTAFALATVLFVPGSLFGLTGGALFGPLWGTILNLLGATLGATIAFLVARHTGADWIAARMGGGLKRIVAGVEAEGWRFVAMTRLVPIVPFNVLNYALGLTRIRLSHYVIATLICMLPGTAAYSWLGHAGRTALQGDKAGLQYGLLGLALLALIAFLPPLVRRLRKEATGWISVSELKERLSGSVPPTVIDVRGPDEFNGPVGHVPDALNVPLGELETRLAVLAPDSRQIVFVCKTDKRSAKAAEILRAHGIKHVMVLRGGMEEWSRHAAVSQGVITPI
jgi:uncharacterized membrane protein YdjX (TVP38/TMEM64 family)/rhodanese-related sulfurtransferase